MPFVLDDSGIFCNKRNGSAPTAMENGGELVSRQFLWLECHFRLTLFAIYTIWT
jgi:hypothetical protein